MSTNDDHSETDQDIELSLGTQAIFANRFRIRVGPDLTRLAFGEAAQAGSPLHYRCSILMPTQDAINMANTLRALADKLQEQIKAMASVGHGEKPS